MGFVIIVQNCYKTHDGELIFLVYFKLEMQKNEFHSNLRSWIWLYLSPPFSKKLKLAFRGKKRTQRANEMKNVFEYQISQKTFLNLLNNIEL